MKATLKFLLFLLAFTALPAPNAQAVNKFYGYARFSSYEETDEYSEEESAKAGGIYLYMSADMGEWTKERELGDHEFAWGWYIDSHFGGGTAGNDFILDFTAQPFGLKTRYNLGGNNLICASYSPLELYVFLPTAGLGSKFSLSLERKDFQIHVSRSAIGLFIGAFNPDKAMNPTYTGSVQYILRSGVTVGLQAMLLTGKEMEGFTAMLFGGWVF